MSDITFQATVSKVQTLADGGLRVTLDMAESETVAMMQLVECKRFEAVLSVTASPLFNSKDQGNAISEGTERKSEWSPSKE